jgi:hypothetical protein
MGCLECAGGHVTNPLGPLGLAKHQSDALNLCDAPPFRVKQAPAFPIIQVEPMSHQRTLLQFLVWRYQQL